MKAMKCLDSAHVKRTRHFFIFSTKFFSTGEKIMKRLTTIFLLPLPVLLSIASTQAATIADYYGGSFANGIGESRHNLGSLGQFGKIVDTTEICVFCHTPHHANSAVEPAPLWNRTNQTEFSYTPYGTTIAGNYVEEVGSVSLACLSCHDGVTTLDNIINAPGKGLDPPRRSK